MAFISGIRRFIVAVNMMDLFSHDLKAQQDRFIEVKNENVFFFFTN